MAIANDPPTSQAQLPAGVRQVIKFLKTWERLILHPADFFKATAEEKKRSFWPAIGFLTAAWFASGILAGVATLAFLWFTDPSQPMNPGKLFVPGSPTPYLISLGIEALLFYAVLHNWFGHDLAIHTTTPFRRIFTELVYANSPVVLVNSLLIFLDGVVAAGFLAVAVPLISQFDDTINDAPGWVGVLIGVSVGLAPLVLLFGPLLLVSLYYYSILLTTLFHVSRRRAASLSLLVCFFAGLPVGAYNLLTGLVVTGFSLSSSELQATKNLKAIGVLATDYAGVHHRQPSIEDVKDFVKGQPQNSFYLVVHGQQVGTLRMLDASNILDGYRYAIQPGRSSAYIRAEPVRCEGPTRRSFVADAGGARLYSSDSCAPATFTDTPVLTMPSD